MKSLVDIYNRPDNYGDRLVIRENLGPTGDQYHKLVPIWQNDIVVDIGGHIGSFAVACALREIHVRSYEPDPKNYEFLKENAQSFGNGFIEIWNRAVVPDDFEGESVQFYPNNLNNSGSSRLEHTRGRDPISVQTIQWCKAIAGGTYIKMDCEGAEYALLACAIPSKVRAIVGEMHLASPFTHDDIYAAVNALEDAGFTVKVPALTKQRTIKFSAIRNVVDETEVQINGSPRNDSPH